MNDIVLATDAADAAAVAAVETHHAELAGALAALADQLIGTARRGGASEAARRALVDWCETELVPHALAEEKGMYPAAHSFAEGRLLVDSMVAEHAVIVGLVREVAEASTAVDAAAAARALVVMFDSHLAKENELVLPLLAASPDVSVAALLEGMHELLGPEAAPDAAHDAADAAGGCGGHTCGCGEVDDPGYPVLDARAVPHAIRHATIFGALDTVRPGGGLVLLAPHDPLPLIAQVNERYPGGFDVDYLERGPETWRLLFLRRDAA